MADLKVDRAAAVAAYKAILQRVLDNRPSGTRHRLAEALGKNRSFITQITSPAYAVPVPAQHLATLLEVCHFTPDERREFLAAYARAHHRRLVPAPQPPGSRTLTLQVPDLGARRNRLLDEAVAEVVRRLARLTEEEP